MGEISEETCIRGDGYRSQSLSSTARQEKSVMAQTEGNRSSRAGERAPPKTYPGCLESTESKAVPREVRQEGGSVKAGRSEGESEAARVPERAKNLSVINR